MICIMQQLKYALQMLALPVTGQVHLIVDDCARVELLAEAFNTSYQAVRAEPEAPLTPEQTAAMARLESRLRQIGRELPWTICREAAMRKSAEWRSVKRLAREALIAFHWPLAVPSPEAMFAGANSPDGQR